MVILRKTEKAVMRTMCLNFIRFKGYFGWTSQGEWSAMVWACFENSVGF